jgi:predicted RNA binding protein YcfA (HicA-like mRNA interferase family)
MMMARRDKIIEQMRRNPKGDWRIEDLETVARSQGINVRRPPGSHVVFEHPGSAEALSVPARRPIKPVYVRRFVALIDGVKARR